MKNWFRFHHRERFHTFIVAVAVFGVAVLLGEGCRNATPSKTSDDGRTLRQVLYVQDLYNNHPKENITPVITAVIDSMRQESRNPYYFAALNILIDRLFSEGRFSEADSLAVRMEEEAKQDRDSTSMAIAKRVRAQMFFKLSQTEKAFRELAPAADFIADPCRTASAFGTASSIQEWLWIIARELGDTAAMNRAGRRFAYLVEKYEDVNNWSDSTRHYPVTALAFRAEDCFSRGDIRESRQLLDSANVQMLPNLPPRAYEHLFEVRCQVRAADNDGAGAIADVDTLLSTHKDFPWFYLKDLFLKARVLSKIGSHEQSARAFAEYVAFHDSLSNVITDSRLNDLTVLYRSEIDHEQQKTHRIRIYALGTVIILLLLMLVISYLYSLGIKKKNRILVERLREEDLSKGSVVPVNELHYEEHPAIERLDRYMLGERPFCNPALGRKELADFLGITSDALGQLIKNEKGMSVKNYINGYRLEEARRVLGSDFSVTISDLAARLGFGTARTLQRAFKDQYDMSPSQYRSAAKDLNPISEE